MLSIAACAALSGQMIAAACCSQSHVGSQTAGQGNNTTFVGVAPLPPTIENPTTPDMASIIPMDGAAVIGQKRRVHTLDKLRNEPQQTEIEGEGEDDKGRGFQIIGHGKIKGLAGVLQRQEQHHSPHAEVDPHTCVFHIRDDGNEQALAHHVQCLPVSVLPAGAEGEDCTVHF